MTEESATPAEQEQPPSLSLLASEKFKGDFYGEVSEPEPIIEEVAPVEEIQAEEIDTQEEAQPDEVEEAEEPEVISYVDELAEYLQESQGLEIDPEWLETLQVKGKVNGEEVSYTISDLRSAAQKVDAADNILEMAKEKAKAHQQELQQKSEQVVEQFTVASTLVQHLEQGLVADYEAVNWDQLRTDDPAEYSAKKTEFQERQQGIQDIKNQAAQSYVQFTQQQQAEMEQQRQELLIQEQDALLKKLPSWNDADTAQREREGLSQYLGENGFTPEEVRNALDHRLIVLARKAWLFDQQPVTTEATRKKLNKIPKTLTPGPKKSPSEISQTDLNAKRDRLRKTGSIKDGLAAYQARKAQ